MNTLPQIAHLEPVESRDSASLAFRSGSAELAQRLSQQRTLAAEFRRHYDEQLAALERASVQRLDELEQRVRRRVEDDYQFAADEMARQRRRLKKKEARLETDADRVELRRTRTKTQRRRLATYFRIQRRRLRSQDRKGDHDQRYQALAAQRDELAQRLAEASRQQVAPSDDGAHSAELEDLRSRLERALNDVRDLKRRNADLEQRCPPAGAKNAAVATVGLDWESQKQRMLAALEADDGGDQHHDEMQTQERLTIDGTIRITDSVVQAKDREIQDLQARLEQKGATAVLLPSVAAMAEIFDRDEGIRHERERLKQLEEQWQGKLRQAEIDLSMERAKLARQQAELEELRRVNNHFSDGPGGTNNQPGESKAPVRGRWLARLGLTEGE